MSRGLMLDRDSSEDRRPPDRTVHCVTDLGGPVGNQSFGAGLGLDTNIDEYEGRAASNGQNIVGWGLTVGEGLGAGGSVGGSKTVIIPLGTL